MNINLPNHAAIADITSSTSGTKKASGPSAPFSDLVSEFVQGVDGQQKAVSDGVQQIAMGDANNLQEIAVTVAKADLSFQFLMELRDKLTASYQEVMRMQV